MATRNIRQRVLLVGASDLLGRHIGSALDARDYILRRASARPRASSNATASHEEVLLDLDDADTLLPALYGCDAAIYLSPPPRGPSLEEREQERARRLAEVAARAGVQRIVYVGELYPVGHPSHLLRMRGAVGRALRQSGTPTVELQPSLVVGAGGASWNVIRDLAVRLPLVPEAPWLSSHLEPIAVDDVATAVADALLLHDGASAVYGVPGPERMSARTLLERVAALAGRRPRFVAAPSLPPPLVARAIPLLTRADAAAARSLIEGLRADLVSQTPSIWSLLGDVALLPLDVAVRRALNEDHMTLPLHTRAFESLLARVTPWARTDPSSKSPDPSAP